MNTETIISLIVLILLLVGVCVLLYTDGYKKGQTDALSGKQKYRLIEFPDGTRIFYYEPKRSDFFGDSKNFKIIK